MGKNSALINKDTTLVDLLVKWNEMNNIAQNLFDCSDLCFLRFFRLLYKKDKRFLALFIKNHQKRLNKKHYLYAKDSFSKINVMF